MIKKNLSIQLIALNFIEHKDNKNFSLLIDRLRPGLFKFAYNYLKEYK